MSIVGGMDLRDDVFDILRWNVRTKRRESSRISKDILKTLASSLIPWRRRYEYAYILSFKIIQYN